MRHIEHDPPLSKSATCNMLLNTLHSILSNAPDTHFARQVLEFLYLLAADCNLEHIREDSLKPTPQTLALRLA